MHLTGERRFSYSILRRVYQLPGNFQPPPEDNPVPTAIFDRDLGERLTHPRARSLTEYVDVIKSGGCRPLKVVRNTPVDASGVASLDLERGVLLTLPRRINPGAVRV